MAQIKIVHSRNFTFGDKIYGVNGQYTVTPDIARKFVREGKAIVLEMTDEEAKLINSSIKSDPEFLKMIEDNADSIIDILDEAFKRRRLTEREQILSGDKVAENETKPSTEEATKESAPEIEVGTNNSTVEGATTPAAVATVQQESESGQQTQELPDDFPGREILGKAGINTVEEIPRERDKLMAIDQMTGRVANLIEAKLTQ